MATFDITILDDDGAVIAEIEEFAVKRISPEAASKMSSEAISLEQGRISTRDGLEALRRVLSSEVSGTIFMSPLDVRAERQRGFARLTEYDAANDVVAEDDVERVLGEIWKRLLGLERVDPALDFYDSGGHSLIAVRLFAEIRKRFGVDLGLSALFEARTVSALAGAIREARTPETKTKHEVPGVLALRANGTKPPLFLIHPIGGSVFNYMDLVKAFPSDQPVYGVESPGLHGGKPYYEVEAMAAHYVRQIRVVQPEGPYFLAGHSFGGQVAYEIGRQLTEAGERVGLIGVIDTFLNEAMSQRVTTLLKRRNPAGFFVQSDVRERLTMALGRRAVRLGYRSLHGFLRTLRVRMPALLENTEQANWIAFDDYAPKASNVRVVLYRCQKRLEWDHPDFLMGWGELARGGVDVCEIPGDHQTMLLEPGVRRVAEHLAACVARGVA